MFCFMCCLLCFVVCGRAAATIVAAKVDPNKRIKECQIDVCQIENIVCDVTIKYIRKVLLIY